MLNNGHLQQAQPDNEEAKKDADLLSQFITAYSAPIPNQRVVFSDYEAKKKPRHNQQNQNGEIAELEPPMVREFAIHILQTIHFL